jgi:hypothetical protein
MSKRKNQKQKNHNERSRTAMTKASATITAAAPPREQRTASFSKRIGSTTFLVSVHFSGTSKETAGDKIARLVRMDAERKAANL